MWSDLSAGRRLRLKLHFRCPKKGMDPILQKARRLYWCMDADALTVLRQRENHTSWEGQQSFVEHLVRAYPGWPIGRQFRARIFKAYLKDVSHVAEEVNEELLMEYLLLGNAAASHVVADISKADGDEERVDKEVYRVFELPGDVVVPLKQKLEFNEVSETIWPAGLMLAEYAFQNRLEFRGKRVLELGCGVGVTGIFLWKSCQPAHLFLTDYSEAGLDLVRENLELNGITENCTVTKIDWTTCTEEEVRRFGPIDVIIMADCWYDVDVCDACVSTVAMVCTANPGCYLVNATALRNPRTYSVYHDAFFAGGFSVDALHLHDLQCSMPGLKDKYTILMERFVFHGAQVERAAPPTQSTAQVLMVSPDHFSWSTETSTDNAFMNAPLDSAKMGETLELIRASHSKWVDLLRQHGIGVRLFAGDNPNAPDAVFPNNWFSTHVAKDGRRCMALFPMAHPSRRLERRPDIITFLKEQYPDECLDLTHWEAQGKFFEGTGSAVVDWIHGFVFVSLSTRAHQEVAAEWTQWLSKIYGRVFRCVFFASHHKGAPVYHTNVVMSIGSRYAVCCFDAIEQSTLLAVRLSLRRRVIVEITPSQMEALCGNVLELRAGDQHYCVMSSRSYNAFSEAQRKQIEGCNVQILVSDLDLLEKLGGGGIRCCIAELFT